MYDRRQKIIEKIQTLPTGSVSASGRYWCVTCKKLFRLEQPVCTYMTAMCVNSPIAFEKFVPESTEWLEKMRDKVHQSLEEYMTTVRDELGAPPDRPAVEALYLAQCARVLDADVVSREWTAESTALTDIEGVLRGATAEPQAVLEVIREKYRNNRLQPPGIGPDDWAAIFSLTVKD